MLNRNKSFQKNKKQRIQIFLRSFFRKLRKIKLNLYILKMKMKINKNVQIRWLTRVSMRKSAGIILE
jgi:hypothetical protein